MLIRAKSKNEADTLVSLVNQIGFKKPKQYSLHEWEEGFPYLCAVIPGSHSYWSLPSCYFLSRSTADISQLSVAGSTIEFLVIARELIEQYKRMKYAKQ